MRSACRSPATGARPATHRSPTSRSPPREPRAESNGQDIPDGAREPPAQVRRARALALPALRAPARGVPQVRALPHLPARARPPGVHPRHDEVELVSAMSMTDPIADFLTRIRNGIMAAHEDVEIPASGLKAEMARILAEQGYIEGYEVRPAENAAGDRIHVRLKYTDNRTS